MTLGLSDWDKLRIVGNAFTVHNIGEILTVIAEVSTFPKSYEPSAEDDDDSDEVPKSVSSIASAASPSFSADSPVMTPPETDSECDNNLETMNQNKKRKRGSRG
jgi:hypothetical protein